MVDHPVTSHADLESYASGRVADLVLSARCARDQKPPPRLTGPASSPQLHGEVFAEKASLLLEDAEVAAVVLQLTLSASQIESAKKLSPL